jgi:general secretion pathway protein E
MSELDIAERRVPQDGRFRLALKGRPIDFRVSVMPSVHGEDAVLRILDKQALTKMSGLRLDVLGFDDNIIAQLRRLSALPYGMLLVTGPTGSGKTTSLYAAISETQTGRDKIITIEDPVEYQLPGVLQIPVNEKKGLTFARGLRSILRHDPDKIMVGEIRDPETAQIAIQSALTGHLVFTTVHANNVFDVVSLHAPARAARGIERADRDRRRLPLPQRARLRPLPRHRLPRPQGGGRAHGAERRDPRGDREPRAGAAVEGARP